MRWLPVLAILAVLVAMPGVAQAQCETTTTTTTTLPCQAFPATGQTTCYGGGGGVIPCAGRGQEALPQRGRVNATATPCRKAPASMAPFQRSGTPSRLRRRLAVVALCLSSGRCHGAPADVARQLRADAQAHATGANGFAGDPRHPVTGRIYGDLVWAGGY